MKIGQVTHIGSLCVREGSSEGLNLISPIQEFRSSLVDSTTRDTENQSDPERPISVRLFFREQLPFVDLA